MDPPSHTGLFAFIREQYHEDTLRSTHRLVNTSKRLARHYQHLVCNNRCRRYSLIPRHLQTRPIVNSVEGLRLAQKYSRQALSALTVLNHRTIVRLKKQLEQQYSTLERLLSSEVFARLSSLSKRAFSQTTIRCKGRQKEKFDTLLQTYHSKICRPIPDAVRERWVVNLTNAQLSKSEVEVLEKGLSFSPALNKLPTTHLISAAEKGLSKLQSNVASDARKRIASLLSQSKPPPSNLIPEQKIGLSKVSVRVMTS